MIALDTNVLARYIMQDGGRQAAVATRFIEQQLTSSEPGFVSLPVICELAWILRTSYSLSEGDVRTAISLLHQAVQIEIQDRDLVAIALEYDSTGLADAIIHLAGAAQNCAHTVTFDKKFARLEGVKLLK